MMNTAQLLNHRLQAKKSIFLNKGFQVFTDALILSAAFLLSYLLRFEFAIPPSEEAQCLKQLLFIVPYQLLALRLFGVHRQIWRYIGVSEVQRILIALAASSALILLFRVVSYALFGWMTIPISIILFDLCVAAMSIIGVRSFRRVVYERYEKKQTSSRDNYKKPVFLIGAGRAGVKTLAEIKGRGDIDIEVKGFIDDDMFKRGAVINGVKVLGGVEDLPLLVKSLNIDHVIISIAQASGQNIKRIIKVCEEISIKVRTIPGLYELIQGNVTVSRIRDLQIEDLLGRPSVELDKNAVETFLKDKRVMVTGAGGSIGSELVRQIIRCAPREVILIERSELALFNIEREISELSSGTGYQPIVADICNESQMARIFEKYSPQIVFHAAAHKHVPLMECNTPEAVRNNVFGTLATAELAGKFGAEAFVLISTDKAVNPTSVMGATKRVAELVIQNLNQRYDTRYLAVRFGNVIGSAGSVIPIFQEQIKKGGPVTVTHPEMKRFFMTIPEATQLVMQAGAIGSGGEIFILDMGEQVKIVDLARETIKLSGLQPGVDIEIVFKGIRPGEKLYEELEITSEELVKTVHPKIFIGKILPYSPEAIKEALVEFSRLCLSDDGDGIRRYLNKLLPEATITEPRAANSSEARENRAPDTNVVKSYPAAKTTVSVTA